MRKSLGLLNPTRLPVNLRTLSSAAAIFSSILTTQASADYIYDIQNHPTVQNGWTLSGQITTTVDSGTLSSLSDITSWSWSATNGSTTYTFRSSDAGAAIYFAGVVLTPSSILLPVPQSLNTFLSFQGGLNAVDWARIPGPHGFDFYLAETSQTTLWTNSVPGGLAIDPGGSTTDPWVIATAQPTPEPATITMLVSGYFAIGGFGLYRRRRRRASESSPVC